MSHKEPHPLADKSVTLSLAGRDPEHLTGSDYRIEDWWDRVSGQSWMDAKGNPAALKYAVRSGFAGLPIDNEVVYGKVNGIGHLVHVSELGPERPEEGR